MPINTYFGDVLTKGDTTARQNVTVQGTVIYFNSNLGSNVDQGAFIGSSATPWNSVYLTGANTTTANLTSIPGQIGIGTSTGIGANVQVQGNVVASNTIVTTNVLVTNANTTTLNVTSVVGPSGFVGINTGVPSGTALYVQGNTYVSNGFLTQNVFTTNVNVLRTANMMTVVVTSNVGIGTTPPTNTQLYVVGNAYLTNALTSSNIFITRMNVSGSANLSTTNVTTLNVSSISGATLNVTSASNLSTTNVTTMNADSVLARTLNVTSASNLASTNVTTMNVRSVLGETLNVTGTSNLSAIVYASTINTEGITNSVVFGSPSWAMIPFDNSLVDTKGKLTSPVGTGTLTYTTTGGPYGGSSLQLATASWVNYTASSTAINIDITGASMSFWFKAESTIPSGVQGLIYFQATNTAYGLFFQLGTTQGVFYFSTSGGDIIATQNISWVVGQWYHITCVVDPISKTITSWRNGSLIATSTAWIGTAGYLKDFFRVGAWWNPPSNAVRQPTSFADVRVYDRTLSSAEILSIYNGGELNLTITGTSNLSTINVTTLNTASIFGTNLNVNSDSNLSTTNVTTLNVATANATNMAVRTLGNIATLNVYTSSNAAIMNAASLFAPTLNVTSVSNLSTTNVTTLNGSSIFGTNLNVASTANIVNVVALSNIGIGAQPGTTNLYVMGNMYVTNALTVSNIFTTNVNVSGTTNTLTLIATSNIGIGTTGSTGANLYIQGNAFVANAFTTTNILATGNISYGEDLTKRYPHLIPDSTNAASIQTWISATVNASSQPTQSWWPTSRTPVFGNVISTATSNGAYNSGGVLLPSGAVVFVPNSSNLLEYSGELTQLSVTTGIGIQVGNFGGGVLLPNGNVLFVPQISNVGLYNPVVGAYSNVTTKARGRYSGVLTANNVVLTPYGAPSNVIVYDHVTTASTNVLAIPSPNPVPAFATVTISSNIWSSAVWAPELGIWCAVSGWASDGSTSGPSASLPSNRAATSPDGITWTNRTLPAATYWSSVTWAPQLGLFCAVAGGGYPNGGSVTTSVAATSPDGITWTSRTLPAVRGWTSVCWSPQLGLFCAIAAAANDVATSPDGSTWTFRSTVLPGVLQWSSVTWSPQLGLFCAVAGIVAGKGGGGSSDTTTIAATSPNGTTWTSRTLPTTDSWPSVCWSPELKLFCTVGGGVTSGSGLFASSNAATSSDGVTWSLRTLPVASYWSAVTWSPQLGQFMAVSGGGDTRRSTCATSSDGITWASRTLSNTWYWSDVQWSPHTGKYLILAGNKGGSGIAAPAVVTTNVIATTTPYRVSTGTALLPTGNIVFSPAGSSNIMQLDPVSLTQSNIRIGNDGFTGLVLAPNGNVIGVPMSSNVITVDPANRTASNTGINTTGNVYGSFNGGCLLPSGNVMFTPGMSANVGMFSPSLLTYSNSTVVGSNSFVKFSGATLLPSGQVVMPPWGAGNVAVLSTDTPAPKEMCLSPYFNKF